MLHPGAILKSELLERIPRIPHWRFVLYLGERDPHYSEEMAQLRRYLDDEGIDVGLSQLEDPDKHLERAQKIYLHERPIKSTIENMLTERCSNRIIVNALYHKFKEAFSIKVIRRYRKFFFDTKVMNTYDMARYYESNSMAMPKPPPVPGSMKEAYVAHQNGVDADINMQDALMHMFKTSFFRSQELKEFGWAGDDKVLKFQKNAMDLVRVIKEGSSDTPIPEEFNYVIEYPGETSVSHEDIEGYDPGEDPNV